MGKRRSQSSIEFLMLFGFVFLMIIPLIMIFFTQSNETKDTLNSNQIRNIAIKISDKAESAYYLGAPSKTTLKVYFPDGIKNITISNREIVFNYLTGTNNLQEIVQTSKINVTGNISGSSGIHYISIENMGEYVSITEKPS